MKKLFLFTIVYLLTNMSACYSGQPVAKQTPDNNQTYKVDYLFEHDGCKVYRFHDKGNWVYFTNCGQDVTAIKKDSTKVRVQTVGSY